MAEKTDLRNSKELLRAQAEEIVKNKMLKLHNQNDTMPIKEVKKMFEELEIHKIELEMQNEALKTTQDELSNSKQKYFDLYNLAPVGYITINHEGMITAVNLTAATMLGVTRSSLIRKHLSAFMSYEDQDRCYLFRKKILDSKETQSCDIQILKKDGTGFWAHFIGKRVDDSSINVIISDMSELKQMQDEIRNKDEMIIAQSRQAAMGEMISMIAHQWRQPLNVVAMAVNNLSLSMQMEEEISEKELTACIDTVSRTTQQLSETIANFMGYFRPQQITEQITAENILDTTLSIIGTSLENDNISITIQNTTERSFLINKASLIQVLLNILVNAKEALLLNNVKEPEINISANETKDTIIISVCDNAGGIKESLMKKIGQPYFTTKKELNGTGLGLYMSKTIIEKHLFGTLTWHNEAKGACFVITFKSSISNQ